MKTEITEFNICTNREGEIYVRLTELRKETGEAREFQVSIRQWEQISQSVKDVLALAERATS